MLGVINLLRRQLCVFLHVWGTLSFQVREYEEREQHFDLQADDDRKGIGRGLKGNGVSGERGERKYPPPSFLPLNPLLACSFVHIAGTASEPL